MRILFIAACFCFCASAFAQAEMDLLRSGNSIANAGTDSISFTGYSPFNLTYTIQNDGTTDLTITLPLAISNETNCAVSVLSTPATLVSMGGGTTTFSLQVSPTSASDFSFELAITNSDPNENPYNITFHGSTGAASSSSSGGSSHNSCSSAEPQSHELLLWLGLLALVLSARLMPRKPPDKI